MPRLNRPRLVLVALGLALTVAVSVGPFNRVAETRLFSVHMAQHVVVLDLAPLLLVIGLGPRARIDRLAAVVAGVALWIGDLYVWHLPYLYDGALRHEWVHALQHASFLLTGIVLWSAVLGTGALGWRLAAVAAAGLASAVLGNVFLWAGHAFYEPYIVAPRLWGLSPVADQRLGGAIMLAEGSVVMLAAAAWIILRWTVAAERAG